MFTFTAGQLEAWIGQYFWPFVRIGACLMVAPVFGTQFVPARMRIILAAAITLLVAPLIAMPQPVAILSYAGIVITVQQIIVGLAVGFAVQIVFDALSVGGQLLANSMGLSFAMNVDPVNGASTPVIGQFYTLMVTLTFLAMNGHLALIQMLVDGFTTLPVGENGLGDEGVWTLVLWGGQLFSGALTIALPGLTALLVVNLGFGVMSRAAPTLNLFAVGFPVTLMFGLVIVFAGLPAVQSSFVTLLEAGYALVAALLRGGG